jgi:predicted ATPase
MRQVESQLIIPLTGGPCSGKTTTLKALGEKYPRAFFVEEAAEIVITRELAKAASDQDYIPKVPMNPAVYQEASRLILDKTVALGEAIPAVAKLVFRDRSEVDCKGYDRLNGFDAHMPELERRIKAASYSLVFFCEMLPVYEATAVRHEDAVRAQLTHDYLAQAYEESGIEVVYLPPVSIEKRLQIIEKRIEQYDIPHNLAFH